MKSSLTVSEILEVFYGKALENRIRDQDFKVISIGGFNEALKTLIKDGGKPRDSEMKSFVEAMDRMEKMNHKYDDVLNEKMIVNTFAIFEEFCYRCFFELFARFPKYLASEKLSVSPEDIFDQNDLLVIRQNLIHDKVKSIIQKNSVIGILESYNRIFKIVVKTEIRDENNLYYLSQVRNIITHNNGNVNHTFLKNLKSMKIKSDLRIGDIVVRCDKDVSNTKKYWESVDRTMIAIKKAIGSNETRLIKHSESK